MVSKEKLGSDFVQFIFCTYGFCRVLQIFLKVLYTKMYETKRFLKSLFMSCYLLMYFLQLGIMYILGLLDVSHSWVSTRRI